MRFYSGAYGNVVPFEIDLPTSASSPTVMLPTIRVQGPTLTGASRDALGWAVPDIELWASDDRGEELSFFHARTFGNDAGDYGVFMKDGNWHFEPRSPRGCLPLVTDPFDVVVQNGVVSPAVKNLAWHPVGTVNTGSVTVGVPSGPGQIDLGTPAGHVSVPLASSSGTGTITTAYHGGAPALPIGETVTSMSSTPDGSGYWLFTTAGRAVPRGSATFLGDMSGTRLNGPVLDSIPTPSGRGLLPGGVRRRHLRLRRRPLPRQPRRQPPLPAHHGRRRPSVNAPAAAITGAVSDRWDMETMGQPYSVARDGTIGASPDGH